MLIRPTEKWNTGRSFTQQIVLREDRRGGRVCRSLRDVQAAVSSRIPNMIDKFMNEVLSYLLPTKTNHTTNKYSLSGKYVLNALT